LFSIECLVKSYWGFIILSVCVSLTKESFVVLLLLVSIVLLVELEELVELDEFVLLVSSFFVEYLNKFKLYNLLLKLK